jgi:hypothetical protein
MNRWKNKCDDREWVTDLTNVTVFTLLLGILEGGHTGSIDGRHFWDRRLKLKIWEDIINKGSKPKGSDQHGIHGEQRKSMNE